MRECSLGNWLARGRQARDGRSPTRWLWRATGVVVDFPQEERLTNLATAGVPRGPRHRSHAGRRRYRRTAERWGL